MRQKRCTLCNTWLDVSDFYAHKRTKDRLQSLCKACHKVRKRASEKRRREARPGIKGAELAELVKLQIQHLEELRQ